MAKNESQNESQEVERQDQDAPRRPLTWEEKLDKGKKLSPLQEVQADADFNHKKRVRDDQEREEYEARKASYNRNSDAE